MHLNPTNHSRSHERRVSPELAGRIQRRLNLVYRATEIEHAAELENYPDLFTVQPVSQPVAEERTKVVPIVGNTAVERFDSDQIRQYSEEAERLAQIRREIDELAA